MTLIKVQTQEGQIHELDKKVAQMLGVVKNMLEDIGEDSEHPIPLPSKWSLSYFYAYLFDYIMFI